MHVVVNAAMSADGKLSTREREQVEISGPADFDRVDALRAESDAVMVGVGTVLADDPSLTVDDDARRERRRDAGKPENPARIVADSRIRTPTDARVLDDRAETILLTSEAAPQDFVAEITEAGAEVVSAGQQQVDLPAALAELESRGIERLMVEGGGELIFSLFAADLVDELSTFVGAAVIGGWKAPTLADGDGFVDDFPELSLRDVERIDDGVLIRWDVP
ncbi:2,5-diamino-6-(ribosylamino)-4(3H)-pyrimidinone 5'-phosphate reductase [Halosimplex halophilum]|uniref:2,5-diamino-6-(ribosylamino)-4(3H)-pyrimidinone 5'-phosphate reductase n=1 Tax=Halosimplex halophilum TaxID=2559572 RepID=UPI00107F07A1|nr:2,5-diamino-6-(ribosylamino)-4(3H)-pyrimidinone 5'-phosphate reductase [Halosimplex halophilum]